MDHLTAPRSPEDGGAQVDSVSGGATTVSVEIVVRTAAGLLEAVTGVRNNVCAALSQMAGLARDIVVDVHVVDVVDVDVDELSSQAPPAPPAAQVVVEVASALTVLVQDATTALVAVAHHGVGALTGAATPVSWPAPLTGGGHAPVARTGSHRLGLVWPPVSPPTEGNP